MGKAIAASAATVALLLVPGAAAARAASCAGAARAAQSATTTTARDAVLCLVNRHRDRQGLRPLRASKLLNRAAQGHSADMVRRGYFAHESPEGGTLTQRVRRTGFLAGARAWELGEAIGWAGGSAATPASMVRMWLDSPPHRAILLDRSFRLVGIGVADGTPAGTADGATFTLDAGRR